jgi:hypothetical protein
MRNHQLFALWFFVSVFAPIGFGVAPIPGELKSAIVLVLVIAAGFVGNFLDVQGRIQGGCGNAN